MAIPTKDLEENILNQAPWVASGSPLVVDDAWNPEATFDLDRVNDEVDFGSEIFTSGQKHSVGVHFNTSTAATMTILDDRDLGSGGGWYIRILASGALEVQFADSFTNFLKAPSTNTDNADGTDRHVIITVDGTTDTIKIYVNDIDVSGTTTKGGTGYPGGTDGTTLHAGASETGSLLFGGVITRFSAWFADVLTPFQTSEEFAAEQAAKGEGFTTKIHTPIYDPIYTPIYSPIYGA